MVAELRRLSGLEILALEDLTWEDVEVPEWNAIVRIQSMTGKQRDSMEASMVSIKGKNSATVNYVNLRAKVITASAVDERGERLFTESQVAALGEKNAAALQRLFEVAQRLSGLTKEDIEELTIDLGEGRSDGSGIS